jgi:hypothetical protein
MGAVVLRRITPKSGRGNQAWTRRVPRWATQHAFACKTAGYGGERWEAAGGGRADGHRHDPGLTSSRKISCRSYSTVSRESYLRRAFDSVPTQWGTCSFQSLSASWISYRASCSCESRFSAKSRSYASLPDRPTMMGPLRDPVPEAVAGEATPLP